MYRAHLSNQRNIHAMSDENNSFNNNSIHTHTHTHTHNLNFQLCNVQRQLRLDAAHFFSFFINIFYFQVYSLT